MNGDAKQTRTKAIKSQCRRGVRASVKIHLILITESSYNSYNIRPCLHNLNCCPFLSPSPTAPPTVTHGSSHRHPRLLPPSPTAPPTTIRAASLILSSTPDLIYCLYLLYSYLVHHRLGWLNQNIHVRWHASLMCTEYISTVTVHIAMPLSKCIMLISKFLYWLL